MFWFKSGKFQQIFLGARFLCNFLTEIPLVRCSHVYDFTILTTFIFLSFFTSSTDSRAQIHERKLHISKQKCSGLVPFRHKCLHSLVVWFPSMSCLLYISKRFSSLSLQLLGSSDIYKSL